ncbi:alpha/beta fold hydrolase [Sphingomonas histidinilytica]|jgi:pimeloyl-ACP methyl ester carboxylesterase|uniref:Pimeloyl-ACP methyl ester carboxylesterase n=1 Tax=Rhizorhabdus histidinilytica TaxID=439228 RepID=A0A1T5BKG5_9SPHN|nr:alpha/beta hydrolase [Rhizorhabdus histidinilytica]MBO9377385.1 alpha/beta fold hydrolase [Rhizorhabdus histidinilytica]QEH77563.1 alpha/beta hydrolase [Sphingomonas sp. C8-2]SKB47726.1 Pimeloyl-ACP methyl ester carboxylesterase [Rhizorhabdus histidinilytica]
MSEIETRRFAAHGLTLVGDVGGPEGAPAVVLLHGGGQTRHSWAGTMQRLIAQGYRVINLDARGHGESDWAPDGSYRLSDMAQDLRMVLATLGQPVALVGASMGGMTAFHAIGSSDRPIADALVMVDIVLKPAEAGAKRIQAFMRAYPDGFASVEEAADAVSAYYPERPRPKDVSGLRKNLRLREDGRFRWHWDPRILDMGQRAEPPGPFETLAMLAPKVTLPTLLVRGGKSDIVDDAGVAEMVRLVPQTEVFDVPGAGHMVAGDMNDPFSAGMIAFLERHLPSGG